MSMHPNVKSCSHERKLVRMQLALTFSIIVAVMGSSSRYRLGVCLQIRLRKTAGHLGVSTVGLSREDEATVQTVNGYSHLLPALRD